MMEVLSELSSVIAATFPRPPVVFNICDPMDTDLIH